MTFPHTDVPPPDPSAPTCPSCGVVAAAGAWPAGYEVRAWYCLECMRDRARVCLAAARGVGA